MFTHHEFTLRDFLLIFITVFIWGTNFVAIRWGLDELPPFYFTALRFILVAFPLILFIKPPKLELWKVLGVGVFISLGQFSLLFLAIELGLRAGLASLLMQAQVIFTILLSFFIFRERVSAIQTLGIVVAFIGFGGFYALRSTGGQPIVPLLLAMLAAFSWGCGNMIYKVAGNANKFSITIYSSLVPIIPMLAISWWLEGAHPIYTLADISIKGWASLLYGSYLSTILAYSLWAILLGKYSAAKITPFALLIPIFGVCAAWVLLGERMTGMEVVAAIVIFLGLMISIFNERIVKIFA